MTVSTAERSNTLFGEKLCCGSKTGVGDVVKHRLHAMERNSAAMRDYIVTA